MHMEFRSYVRSKGTWTYQLLPPLALQAPSVGQPASQVQTDTPVVLYAPNSGLRLEKERWLNYFYLPQNPSSFEKLQFLLLLNCTEDNPLHKISLSSSEVQPFSGCSNWRSNSLSLSLLSFCLLILSWRSKVFHLPRAHLLNISQWEASWSSCQFSLEVRTSNTPTHFNVVHDTTPFLIGTQTHVSRYSNSSICSTLLYVISCSAASCLH